MYAFDTHAYALDTPTLDPTLDTARTRSNTLAYALDAPALNTHVHAFNICACTQPSLTRAGQMPRILGPRHIRGATQACMQMQEVWNGGREGCRCSAQGEVLLQCRRCVWGGVALQTALCDKGGCTQERGCQWGGELPESHLLYLLYLVHLTL